MFTNKVIYPLKNGTQSKQLSSLSMFKSISNDTLSLSSSLLLVVDMVPGWVRVINSECLCVFVYHGQECNLSVFCEEAGAC